MSDVVFNGLYSGLSNELQTLFMAVEDGNAFQLWEAILRKYESKTINSKLTPRRIALSHFPHAQPRSVEVVSFRYTRGNIPLLRIDAYIQLDSRHIMVLSYCQML